MLDHDIIGVMCIKDEAALALFFFYFKSHENHRFFGQRWREEQLPIPNCLVRTLGRLARTLVVNCCCMFLAVEKMAVKIVIVIFEY